MLGHFAAHWSAVRWLDDNRFKSPCPLPGHPSDDYSVLVRQINGHIQVACFGGLGHSESQILNALGLTADDLHSQNGAGKGPKSRAGTFSENGTGHHSKADSRRAYALAYAKYGIPVFLLHNRDPDGECSCGKLQCKSLGKHPRHKDWQAEATTDPAKIRELWAEYPSANIGVACGKVANLTVLDVDGEQGKQTLRDLELEHGELPDTPMVHTGSGGVHYYFLYDPQIVGRSRFAPGLDWRTEGNLVVGVGSHNAAGPYVWDAAYSLSDLKPAEMPTWLKTLGQKQAQESVRQDESHAPIPIAQVAQMLQHIDANDRNVWLQVGMALKSEYGIHGRKPWDDYSKRSTKYNLEGQNKAWASIDVDGGIRIGTVIKLAKDGGWQPDDDAPEEKISALHLGQLYALVDQWDRQPWVWEGILPHSSLSLIVGKSETGKSTLIYSLVYGIVTGTDFFNRQCERGRVIYLAGDPMSEVVAGKTFRALGLEDGVIVVPEALVMFQTGMEQLRAIVRDFKPSLIIGDTLAATVPVDTESYGESYRAQMPLTRMAREFGPNFLLSHHSQKSAIDSYSVIDAALGSVGIAAVASSRMGTKLYRRKGQKYFTFEMSNLRIGNPLEGEFIVHKLENGLVELGGLWKVQNTQMDKDAILAVLGREPEPMAKRTLWQELRPKPKWEPFNDAIEELFAEGKITINNGPRGGKLFSLRDV